MGERNEIEISSRCNGLCTVAYNYGITKSVPAVAADTTIRHLNR